MYAGLRVGNLKHSQSLAKEISPTGEGVNHVVKRGEVQIVQSFDTRLHATQDDRPFDTRFALLKDEPFPE